MSDARDFLIEDGVLKKYQGPGGDVVIPEGVTSIGDDAFRGCSILTSVTIPDGVKTIGDGAFKGCSILMSATIPDSVTLIGKEAFRGCKGLKDSSGFTIIRGVLYGYSGKDGSIIIPDSVTSIGDSAFKGRSILTSVTVPDSVVFIGEAAFDACRNLMNVAIGKGVATIYNSAFSGCSSLKNVTIENGLITIGDHAFEECSSLTHVTIPDSVISIGSCAFRNCRSLTSVTFLNGVTSIGDNAFTYCSSLRELTFEGIPGEIGVYALEDCKNASVTISEDALAKRVPVPNVLAQMPLQLKSRGYALLTLFQNGTAWQEWRRHRKVEHPDEEFAYMLSILKAEDPMDYKTGKKVAEYITKYYRQLPPEQIEAMMALYPGKKSKDMAALLQDWALLRYLGRDTTEAAQDIPEADRIIAEYREKEKKSDAEIMNAVKVFYGMTESLPKILCKDGTAAKPVVFAYLLTAHEKLDDRSYGKPDVIAACGPGLCSYAKEIVALLDQESLQQALRKLADENLGLKGHSKRMFLAYPICRYADDALMDELTRKAPKWASVSRGKDAPSLATFRKAAVYSESRAAMLFADKYRELGRYAEVRNTNEETMRDQYLANVGLDASGAMKVDLGNQTVTVRLQKDLSFLVELPGGKTSKSLPKKGADEAVYKAANEKFAEMKKDAKKIIKNRAQLLFEHFLNGYGRASEDWQRAYLDNPLLRQIAELLVWEQNGHTFTVGENGCITADGTPYQLNDDQIRVAHPMEMSPAEVKAWQKYFTVWGLKQPFEQIWEQVVEPASVRADRYVGFSIPYYRFTGVEKHGIYAEKDFRGVVDITLEGCTADICPLNKYSMVGIDDPFEIKSFKFRHYTRQVNHIVAYFDRITVYGRILKDDVSVVNWLPRFTLAQIMDFIKIATENKCTNVAVALLEYKNAHYEGFDPLDEFSLGL